MLLVVDDDDYGNDHDDDVNDNKDGDDDDDGDDGDDDDDDKTGVSKTVSHWLLDTVSNVHLFSSLLVCEQLDSAGQGRDTHGVQCPAQDFFFSPSH